MTGGNSQASCQWTTS